MVDGLSVRVKVSPGRAKAEYDDAAQVARRTGRPLREVASLAEAAFRRDQHDAADRLVSAPGSDDDHPPPSDDDTDHSA